MSKRKKWAKKLSIALIASMIISLMAPVLVLAAMETVFVYNAGTGQLSGSVYVQDPNSVTVSVQKQDGSVTQVTYSGIYITDMYDDQNNKYSSVSFSINLGEAPANVKVQNGSEIADLNHFGSGADYISNSYSSVTLDVYRMQGNFLLTNLQEGSYIAAGSDLFNFTPNVSGADVLEITLPYFFTTHGTFNNVSASDFVIEDVTVGQAVYVDQLIPDSYWSPSDAEYNLRFQMANSFTVGNQYKVKLSNDAVNKIQLPNIGNTPNYFTAVVSAGTMATSGPWTWYDKKNSLYFKSIQLTANSSNSGGGYVPPVNEEKKIVNESSLKNGKDGKVAVDIANGTKQVLLPANAAKALDKNNLELKHEKFTLEIPSDVLADLSGLVSEEDLQDANISFSADVVADQAALAGDINSKGGLKSAKVKSAGEAIDFKLALITKDGKEHKLGKFAKPLKLKLKLSADANSKLAGIYYVADDNSAEYIGGHVADGEITANVTHFSTYAVLEFDKSFADVSSDYWAAGVIKHMAAKHVIAGVSDTDFAPKQDVTRAQFAAFLVRALELKASGAVAFTDVAAGKWYAEEVAAAAEAGIVSGRSDKIFAPEDVISREEMAIMIVRAHEYMTGKKVTASGQAAFADSDKISAWAQSYVNAAYELGYIQGRGNNLLAPSGTATRAESAQVVSLLLK